MRTIEEKETNAEPSFDMMRKFVRITQRRQDGYIEFQFSIRHPEMFVDLVLPPDAFEDFCVSNQVTLLEPL